METGQLKRFAIDSRNILKRGVSQRLTALGINPNGTAEYQPVHVQGGTLFMDNIYDEPFFDKWMALYSEVQIKGYKDVVEEAAYIWFNRLVAIRILQKNGLISPVLAYTSSGNRIPVIVAEARAGKMRTEIIPEDRDRYNVLVRDSAKTQDLFAILIRSYCRYMPVINSCFGGITQFYELLLPDDILSSGGFIDQLNSTQCISDEDYNKTELIGWLYQFYISEKKDAVFAAGGKVEKDDIPAATQIFTPNWIVKYMVENTIGKIWLDNNPWSELKSEMKYLVPNQEKEKPESILRLKSLEEYTIADMACGSGHILNEGFDLLFKMYQEDGYSPKNAIESIFRYNLTGIDLDTRAKQLATFSLLLKALQIVPSFIDCHILPRVYDMPKILPDGFNLTGALNRFFMGDQKAVGETFEAFELMRQADNLGSIMKFDMLSPSTIGAIQLRLKEQEEIGISDEVKIIEHHLRIIVALTSKYAAVVENPPYMGNGNMNTGLSLYVRKEYERSKTDLFAVFMDSAVAHLSKNGKYGMINMHSWMFLSSFEGLRRDLIDNYRIDSLLHLGPRTFDELSGEVVQNAAFVVSNLTGVSDARKQSLSGQYFRLVEGRNCSDKERMFLSFSRIPRVYYPQVLQNNFKKIPGCPIGYWLSSKAFECFEGDKLSDIADCRSGMSTTDNVRFLRYWYEVNFREIGFHYKNIEQTKSGLHKWFPYNKGGGFQKWYGSRDVVVNYENNGEELKFWVVNNPSDPKTTSWSRRLFNTEYSFRKSLTWSAISTTNISVRYSEGGFMFDSGGASAFVPDDKLEYILGLLNSNVANEFLGLLNPTINFGPGTVGNVPFVYQSNDIINESVKLCVAISKDDWDAHELSWSYKANPIVSLSNEERRNCASLRVSSLVKLFEEFWTERFDTLHHSEEEINREFIRIYGLQDELTPDVSRNKLTILQHGEISLCDDGISWNHNVLMKQLISYALGCMFGRYRLDKPGLHIAYPNPKPEELAPYSFASGFFAIDDDAIIPLLPKDSPFPDNAYNRIRDFVKLVFGEDNLTENLNYIEQALGKPIDEFLEKELWTYHKKMYQSKPIYWLFSSPKGAFKALVYMHRFGKYTPELVRSKYLLPYIEHLQERIRSYNDRAALLTTAERRVVVNLEKALSECLADNDVLHDVADRQEEINLDDGVTVNYSKFASVLAKIK